MTLFNSPPMALLTQTVSQIAAPLDPTDPANAASMWFPLQGSTLAPETDWAFYYIYWISVVFTAIIVGVMIFFMLRYRHRKGVWDGEKSASHGMLLEITWSVIPFLLTIVMWWKGIDSFVLSDTPPVGNNVMEIQVKARQWGWSFQYPDGTITTELHIPADQPVTFLMSSTDVIHSFWVPAWRIKKDIVPGRYGKLWVEATVPGDFKLLCTEYCGKDHSMMLAKVVVHPSAEELAELQSRGLGLYATTFEEWFKEASNTYGDSSPVEIGELAYTKWGCNACHNIDGSPSALAPTWKGVFGRQENVTDSKGNALGNVTVDENYIRESILNPQAKLVIGYPPNMPVFKGLLSEEEIDGIIAYMKSLSN
jgi:cytochrome c oxidase subunit II